MRLPSNHHSANAPIAATGSKIHHQGIVPSPASAETPALSGRNACSPVLLSVADVFVALLTFSVTASLLLAVALPLASLAGVAPGVA